MNINFDFDNMFNNIEEIQPTPKGFGPDPRFWKLSRNDDDVGLARIRLLPSRVKKPTGEETIVPFVRVYKYNINLRPFGLKKFIEIESPETVGLKSATADLRKELYKIGKDNEKVKSVLEILKRSERYISNIYVVNDPIKEKESGNVKLWDYGVKLKDKFEGWRNPSAEDLALGAKPINVWHPVEGADIKLVMRKSGGFYNYDDTTHYDLAPLFVTLDGKPDMEKIKQTLQQTYELTEWLDPSHYMTYEEEVEKLLKLFDGSKVEDILKELGVSLYGGKVDNTVVPPNVQQTQTSGVQASETPQNIQSVQQTQATQVSQSAEEDDDLDFLDDL
jgi:hypothetical protein